MERVCGGNHSVGLGYHGESMWEKSHSRSEAREWGGRFDNSSLCKRYFWVHRNYLYSSQSSILQWPMPLLGSLPSQACHLPLSSMLSLLLETITSPGSVAQVASSLSVTCKYASHLKVSQMLSITERQRPNPHSRIFPPQGSENGADSP